MIADDRARYGRLRAMCEFMTNAASAVEHSEGLSRVLRRRLAEAIDPVREARQWIWDIGRLMTLPRPPPAGLHEALEITESRTLEALPAFRDAMNEACEEFFRAARQAAADGSVVEANRLRRGSRGGASDPTPANPSAS